MQSVTPKLHWSASYISPGGFMHWWVLVASTEVSSFSFLLRVLVHEMFSSVEFYLLSQRNPLLSHHLRALELKETQQANVKNRPIKTNTHFKCAAVWFVTFLLFSSTIFLCLQHKWSTSSMCVRSTFKCWLGWNLPTGTRGCREHKQFKKAITPRWHLQGTRGDSGTPSTSLITKGYAGQSWRMGREQCGVERKGGGEGQPQISLETANHINGICWRKDLPVDQKKLKNNCKIERKWLKKIALLYQSEVSRAVWQIIT